MQQLNNGRAKILTTGERTHVSIPIRRNYMIIGFYIIWLFICFYLASSFNASFSLLTEEGLSIFFIIWMGGCIIGGSLVLLLLLWILFGKENIIIDTNVIEVNRSLFGVKRKKQFEKQHVSNFRFNEVPSSIFLRRNGLAYLGVGDGKIKFDYGMKTHSLGLGLDDPEAKYIVKFLKEIV